jgi:hypothetical protein
MPDDATVIVKLGENETMAIDLPENVAGMLLKEGSESHQALMTDIRHNGAHIHNLVRAVVLRKFDELGVAESRANSGLIGTPVASPTNTKGP